MPVIGVQSSYPQDTSLLDMLRSLKGVEEDLLSAESVTDAVVSASPPPIAIRDSSNMMGGNFASAPSSESRYVAGMKAGFMAATQMATQQRGRLGNLLHSLISVYAPSVYEEPGSKSGGMTAAGAYLLIKREIKDPEELEASQRNLDEIKEDIEKKAEEAMTPKDENGEPIERLDAQEPEEGAPPPEITAPAPGSEEVAALDEAAAQPAAVNEAILAYSAIPALPTVSGIDIVV